MKTSSECPVCHGKLSLWIGMRAPTPFRIRCPHCQVRLRTQMRGLWLLVTLMVLLFAGLVAGCVAVFYFHGWRPLLVALGGLFIFWFVAELITGVIFYTHAQFVPEQRAPTD